MRRRRRGRHAATRKRRYIDSTRADAHELVAPGEPEVTAEHTLEVPAEGEQASPPMPVPPTGPRGAGLLAPLAAVGVAVLVLIVGIIVYKTLVPAADVSNPANDRVSFTTTSTTTGARADAAGIESLSGLPSLVTLASALGPIQGTLPGNPELTERLFVVAAGDVLMDRRVADMIESDGGTAPLEDVAHILRRGDVAIVNLETPLSKRGSPKAGKDFTFQGSPEGVDALRSAGIDFVSLANNHALDYGEVALADTISLLARNRIAYAGAGADAKAAWRPAIVTRKNKRVAFLAFSYIEPEGFVAGDNSAGIAGAKEKSDEIASAIRAAKRAADFAIVSFHWGVEYTDYPVDEQRDLGRIAIDAGANMVVAHHPHVIQGIEIYKGRLIAYSLGDFVFDHYSRKTGETFILEATLNRRKAVSARAIPVYITDSGKPQVVTGDDADSILGRLKSISTGFGTRMRISNSVATLDLK